jgi:hypothetical protein
MKSLNYLIACFALVFTFAACKKDDKDDDENKTASVFLLIDEQSIDNGNEPNNFSDVAVNDQLANIGLRLTLEYFKNNVGNTIDLYTADDYDKV